ncbi:hypothetical protein ACP70R_002300 [Stipagrostis hirtigluma subsp. patula]
MKMSHRRFLNLVLRRNNGPYSVSQLETSNLFYESAAAARKSDETKQASRSMEEEVPELRSPPAPTSMKLQPFRSNDHSIIKGAPLFGPFGETKILCADDLGHTGVYDATSHALRVMPRMNAPKGPMHVVLPVRRTAAHAAGEAAAARGSYSDSDTADVFEAVFPRFDGDHTESVYVMDLAPRCPFSFEVLSFIPGAWVWRPLPPPPFVHDHLPEPRQFLRDLEHKATWVSSVAVNGGKIFVSPSTAQEDEVDGTYCFDTVTQEWGRAGDWVMPFVGKAELVTEHGVWLGFSRCHPHRLCAISSLCPPNKVKQQWWTDRGPPDGWSLMDLNLVNLGSGRFCTAKFFDARVPGNHGDTTDDVAVFTGVEVLCSSDRAGRLGIQMVKHKSIRVTNLDIKCVL